MGRLNHRLTLGQNTIFKEGGWKNIFSTGCGSVTTQDIRNSLSAKLQQKKQRLLHLGDPKGSPCNSYNYSLGIFWCNVCYYDDGDDGEDASLPTQWGLFHLREKKLRETNIIFIFLYNKWRVTCYINITTRFVNNDSAGKSYMTETGPDARVLLFISSTLAFTPGS